MMQRLVSSGMSAQGSTSPSLNTQNIGNLGGVSSAGAGNIATALSEARKEVKEKKAVLKGLEEKCRKPKEDVPESCQCRQPRCRGAGKCESPKKNVCKSCAKKQDKQTDGCEQTKLKEAKKELDDAQEHYDTIKNLAGTSKGVAESVTHIVNEVMHFDEIQLFCISNISASFRDLIKHKLKDGYESGKEDYKKAEELTRELERKCRSLQHLAALNDLAKNQKNSGNSNLKELTEFLRFLEEEVIQTAGAGTRKCLGQTAVIAAIRSYASDSEGAFDEGKFNELLKEFQKEGIPKMDELKDVVCSSEEKLPNTLIIPCHLQEPMMEIVAERFTQRRNREIIVIWNHVVDSRSKLNKANFNELEREVKENRIPVPINELRQAAYSSRQKFSKILESDSISLDMLECLAVSFGNSQGN